MSPPRPDDMRTAGPIENNEHQAPATPPTDTVPLSLPRAPLESTRVTTKKKWEEHTEHGSSSIKTTSIYTSYRCVRFMHTWINGIEVPTQAKYVVLGLFPHGRSDPKERIVFLQNPERLFWELHLAAFRLRGLRRTFLSLSHVRGFRVYKCNPETGTHERVEIDKNAVADLRLLLHMYNKWHVRSFTAESWAEWIHRSLNDGSFQVSRSRLSLEIVLGWSGTRISAVILLPVLLSFAIGLYINSQNWTDPTIIQTAWTVASYVVTTGGILAALLAILTSVEDIYN
ncbi:hypothetical protein F5Y10DRAFT_246723 [Nemania abortiva]|nr:hypothetical protein F5Y10DRAFT_246723 [Nemania abortiva]